MSEEIDIQFLIYIEDIDVSKVKPKDGNIDRFLRELNERSHTAYGVTPNLHYFDSKNVIVFVHEIAKDFRDPKKIIKKFNYTTIHEIIHNFLDEINADNEELCHALTMTALDLKGNECELYNHSDEGYEIRTQIEDKSIINM